MRLRSLLVALLVPVIATAQQAAVSDSVLEARTTEIARTLPCPVCQGESIQDSPADLAQQMRLLVKDKLRDGQSPDEIRAYFVGRYGEWILLEPKMTGLNIALYVFPILLIIGGVVFILRFVRRSSTASQSPHTNNEQILQ